MTNSRGGLCSSVRCFLEGQIVAYCDQVKTGSRVAAQIGIPSDYAPSLRSLVRREGCLVKTKDVTAGRVSLWIYRHRVVAQLIDHIDALPSGHVGIWSTGKLFGYSDQAVLRFLAKAAK